jgi:hypothetical protein
MFSYKMIDHANVSVQSIIDDRRRQVAEITINNEFQHRFSHSSRISKHLELMTPEELGERLSGGKYFLINDQLIDFRDGGYNGFVHTPETIDKFMEVIGVQTADTQPLARRRRQREDEESTGSSLVLRKVWDKSEISVPGYQSGGDFNAELSFTWNPFVKTVNSAFDLVRLICENGMVGMTSFLNTKVPLFNRWEEHLDIAARQIQNKVNHTVVDRFQQMKNERASVADCLLIAAHAWNRLTSGLLMSADERQMLERLFAITNPRTHLANVYNSSVYDDKNLAAQLPGHLTHVDLYNIATEIRTHSGETSKSSNHALDRFSNSILFDNDRDAMIGMSGLAKPKLSVFSDAEAAFFGNMS